MSYIFNLGGVTILEKFFKLKENNTTIKTEVIAGITTFFAMAYIIVVNPAILSEPALIMGDTQLSTQIFNTVFFANCIASFIGTFLMGVLAKIPFAQASGMGLNAFFAYTVMLTMGFTFQEALALVFISGILFIIITVAGIREAIIIAIPKNIKIAISGGIGLFIAFVGLRNSGLVQNNSATAVSLVDFSALFNPSTDAATKVVILGAILAVLGFLIIAILYFLKVKGALLIGVIITTILGVFFGVNTIPAGVFTNFAENFSTQFSDFVNLGLFGFADGLKSLFSGKDIITSIVTIVVIVISFSLVDMFDSIGTLLGTAKSANLLDKDGNMIGMKKALFCDAIATTAGAMLGTSTVTTYVESSAGIGEGGKTGLTSVVTSLLFLLAIPLAPFMGIVSQASASPALIFVGALMLIGIKELDFDNISELVPAFLTIALMPLTYSISNGIAFGLISYTIIKICSGKVKEVKLITFIISLLFVIRFFIIGM